MLRIRPSQLEAFQHLADEDFELRVAQYVRDAHADDIVELPEGPFLVEELSEEVLRGLVRGGLRRARRHGLTWEATLTTFVAMMFAVAPNFDEHPIIRQLLTDKELDPDSRLEPLLELTTEENWQAARESYDPAAWYAEDSQRRADAEFVGRLVAHLRREHAGELVPLPSGDRPLAELPDATLSGLVRQAVARARGYGMTWESSLASFVVQAFVMGPNFDEHPIVRRYLLNEKIPPNSRLDDLWRETTEEDWSQAPPVYRVRAWSCQEE